MENIEKLKEQRAKLAELCRKLQELTGYQVYPQRRVAFFHKVEHGEEPTNEEKMFTVWFAETGGEVMCDNYEDMITTLEDMLLFAERVTEGRSK